jgi:hypothetical protein
MASLANFLESDGLPAAIEKLGTYYQANKKHSQVPFTVLEDLILYHACELEASNSELAKKLLKKFLAHRLNSSR